MVISATFPTISQCDDVLQKMPEICGEKISDFFQITKYQKTNFTYHFGSGPGICAYFLALFCKCLYNISVAVRIGKNICRMINSKISKSTISLNVPCQNTQKIFDIRILGIRGVKRTRKKRNASKLISKLRLEST